MAGDTNIEWATKVWNPVAGCTRVSEGCRNCYAFELHNRRHKAFQNGAKLPKQYAKPFNEIQLFPDRLHEPLQWKKPQRIFVNSMSDLFHDDVPDWFLDEVFTTMAKAKQHTFMVLTKRPERMKRYMDSCQRGADEIGGKFPWDNVWLGVSVENQKAADERIPLLLQTPAAIRFLSCEPLLGPVDLKLSDSALYHMSNYWPPLSEYTRVGELINWVIVGGESGPNARPIHPDWVRSLRDQCVNAGVSFFFKQWGEWAEATPNNIDFAKQNYFLNVDGQNFTDLTTDKHLPETAHMVMIGKKKAGRLLDRRTWDEFPGQQDRQA